MIAAITNSSRSARGDSSRPPARIGRITTPGEIQSLLTVTAATPIPMTTSASPIASLRLRVMTSRRIRPRCRAAADLAADQNRRRNLATILPELYRSAAAAGNALAWRR